MQIAFHSPHAPITLFTRLRAERIVTRLAERIHGPVTATVRVEPDGPLRRVEIMLHASRRSAIVGQGRGRTVGPALAEAAANISAQLDRLKPRRRSPAGRRT